MIRYAYICNQVLQLYKKLPSIKFPLDPRLFFEQMDNCKIMTYNKFAELNQCPLQEVFALCESKSGCTHYDVGKNRYLILFNSSRENHNVLGRIRWTLAHEPHIAENNFNNLSNPELEAEADHFAALLLCPMPLYEMLNVESAQDIQHIFGLSWEASNVRWNEYIKWKRNHRKTAWENDMKRLVNQRLELK